MAMQRCLNCVYCVVDPEVWERAVWFNEPILPTCANHPQWPGELRDVTGTPCCNYRRKPKPPRGPNVRMIPLGDGFYAYVDAADYEGLNRYTWHLNNGYASRRENGRRVYMHTQIMQTPKGMVVDHIDGNNANNCRFNLRVCTQAENLRNRRCRHGSSSRFKGVGYDQEHRKWFARCRLEGYREWLGYFDDEIEAAHVYDHAAVKHFGEYARLNFPEEWPPERRAEVYAQRDAADQRAEDRRRKTAEAKKTKKKAKTKRAERKSPKVKPRATKTRKPPNAKRATKPKRATGHESRSTAPKGRQR